MSLVAPEDGKYVIAVREAAYAGNAQSLYRLHVGHFPRPTATLPAGGKFGDHVKVRWIGDVMGETTSEVDLPGHTDHSFKPHDPRALPPTPTHSGGAHSATQSNRSRTTPTTRPRSSCRQSP